MENDGLVFKARLCTEIKCLLKYFLENIGKQILFVRICL